MTDEPFRPALRTQADLERMWRALMSPLGFRGHSLWMVVIQDDQPVPQLMEIVEASAPPDPEEVESFARLLEHLAMPGLRFAFLRSRPGRGRPDATDRAWARALRDAGRRAGAGVDVVHLAHDDDVLPIALDDVLAEPA
ncbi:hypothetical protein [Nocardioides cynanchi]|uniref:hypothetical protein n=1 Tax=Nocardioides cynanchi TaxID=2558918 RepID=UPI0012464841|nr:hypothetical protein [Nocardioides cynanchi]